MVFDNPRGNDTLFITLLLVYDNVHLRSRIFTSSFWRRCRGLKTLLAISIPDHPFIVECRMEDIFNQPQIEDNLSIKNEVDELLLRA
ncbi:hypothetical protein OROMI_011429 [Orobanche minor]